MTKILCTDVFIIVIRLLVSCNKHNIIRLEISSIVSVDDVGWGERTRLYRNHQYNKLLTMETKWWLLSRRLVSEWEFSLIPHTMRWHNELLMRRNWVVAVILLAIHTCSSFDIPTVVTVIIHLINFIINGSSISTRETFTWGVAVDT